MPSNFHVFIASAIGIYYRIGYMGYNKGISDRREWGDRDDIRDCRNIEEFRNIVEFRNIAEFINMNSDYMLYSLSLSLAL